MSFGRVLIMIGLAVVILGIIISLGEKLPVKLGHLPGDIIVRGKHSTFYFPITTCILLSVILSLVMWLINKSK